MGNRASKAASQATKATTSASSSRLAQNSAPPPYSSSERPSRNMNIAGEPVTSASENKNKDILRDASDPTFSANAKNMLSQNLASLGQAQLTAAQQHNSNRFRPNTQAAQVLYRRAEIEAAEGSPDKGGPSPSSPAMRNKLSANHLTTLLDARKDIKTFAELKKLCEDFNCDVDMIQRLAGHVTSPSVSLIRNEKLEKDDSYMSRWVDPSPLQERIAK